MQKADSIIHARWIATVDKDDTLIDHGAIAISRGKIAAVGSEDDICMQYESKDECHLQEHLLIPGLVNAHTHAAMTLLRGYADDLPLMEWLRDHIWPVEGKWVNESFIEAGTQLAMAEMLRGGTTCYNDMYFFPDVTARCAMQAGMRAVVGMIVIEFPTVWANDAEEYISKGLELRDEIRHSDLVTAAFAPHAPYSVSDESLRKIAMHVNELECPVHMHVHETAHEISESVARFGVRPLERLGWLGLLTPNLAAVHMTQLLPGEIETIADRGVQVVHCPESNLKLASGMCPVQDIVDAGVNLAIGTDGAASNNDLDMLVEMRTAALLAKGVSGDPAALDAVQTLRAATLGGAKALGLDDSIGSIEVGKCADMCAINMHRAETVPVYNPVSQCVYSAGREQVTHTWVNGKRLLDDAVLTTVDMQKWLHEASHWRARISAAEAS